MLNVAVSLLKWPHYQDITHKVLSPHGDTFPSKDWGGSYSKYGEHHATTKQRKDRIDVKRDRDSDSDT